MISVLGGRLVRDVYIGETRVKQIWLDEVRVWPARITTKSTVIGDKIYVSYSDSGTEFDTSRNCVHVHDIESEELIDVITGPFVGANKIVVSGTKVYVCCTALQMALQSVKAFDVNSPGVVSTISLGFGVSPVDMVIAGSKGYVVSATNLLRVLDLATETVTKTITVGNSAQALAVNGNKLYVVNRTGNSLSVIDLASETVTKTVTGLNGPVSIAISGSKAYIGNRSGQSVSVFSLTTETITKTVTGITGPESIAISGNFAYIASGTSNNFIWVFDLTTETVVGQMSTPPGPNHITAAANKIFVCCAAVSGEQRFVAYPFWGSVSSRSVSSRRSYVHDGQEWPGGYENVENELEDTDREGDPVSGEPENSE